MAVEIKLPTLLRVQADGQATVAVDGATVGEVFNTLVERYPGLRGNLLDDSGSLHKFVNVYKDDDDIRYLDGLDTKLADGDVLSILPAVAGGACITCHDPENSPKFNYTDYYPRIKHGAVKATQWTH